MRQSIYVWGRGEIIFYQFKLFNIGTYFVSLRILISGAELVLTAGKIGMEACRALCFGPIIPRLTLLIGNTNYALAA